MSPGLIRLRYSSHTACILSIIMCDTASQQPILNYSVCLLRTRSASSVKVASNACINVRRENQLCSSCSRTIPNVHESQSETFGLRFLRSGRRPGVRELLAHLSLACLSSRRSHAWNCTGNGRRHATPNLIRHNS